MSGIWKQIVAIIATNRVTRAIGGWGSWFLSSWLFDDVAYPAMIAWIGPVYGGGIMATIAMIVCYVWMKNVVASGEDWFDMKTLHKVQRIVLWVVRLAKHIPLVKHSWVDKFEFSLTFLMINFAFDPMICVLYYRRDDTSKTLSKKDIKFLMIGGLVSNVYWILRSWGLVTILKYGWRYIFSN